MLVLNKRLSDTSTTLVWLVLLCAAAFCVALGMGWIRDLAGVETEPYERWWVYVIIGVTAFIGAGNIANRITDADFQSLWPHLRDALGRAGFRDYVLLTKISGDEKLKEIEDQLKKTPEQGRLGRTP